MQLIVLVITAEDASAANSNENVTTNCVLVSTKHHVLDLDIHPNLDYNPLYYTPL